MALVSLNDTIKLSKITHFSILEQDENLVTTIEKKDKEVYIKDGFIYDGKELYLFLQNETLKIDDEEYKIVGSLEADPFNNKISNESPIGKAVIGHKAGEVVSVESPNGTYDVTLKSVN